MLLTLSAESLSCLDSALDSRLGSALELILDSALDSRLGSALELILDSVLDWIILLVSVFSFPQATNESNIDIAKTTANAL